MRPIELGLAVVDDKAQRWDGASVHEFSGTYGDYILAKVSKVFPDLRRRSLDDCVAREVSPSPSACSDVRVSRLQRLQEGNDVGPLLGGEVELEPRRLIGVDDVLERRR